MLMEVCQYQSLSSKNLKILLIKHHDICEILEGSINPVKGGKNN